MHRILRTAALVVFAGVLYGQVNEVKMAGEQVKFYNLEFVVKEVEGGKVLNGRAYSLLVSTEQGPNSSIRTGAKVPYNTSPNSMQYLDVGVNIDCRAVRERGGQLSMYISADISSVVGAEPSPTPTIRQNKWSSNVVVPLKKPVVIFSSDDVSGKRKMQLELTANPIG